ncbi:hypothetical protein O6H91_17G052700 [Diphasiastrum complanatum]|uniref:Uncharacterized protein n=2 Tax=Diphasiastrum complanatum TaxID=34168 RepID=A0ACC2B6Q5_DIPCM|nr:hypothetical protein O6H91_17G052700 [Diphasiastrum complanatum]KAJ7525468.1 hypothetical protein O6H91_17G052700 [Diphasiastrum complanatum]
MALQAGMATSKLLVIIGAGVAGSVLLKNSHISEFLTDLSKVFAKHLKEEDPSTDRSDITATLSAQVQRLTQELRLIAGSRSVTVVNSTPSQSNNLTSLAMPVAIIGAAGYGYIWWKGWSFGDLMYVTRRNMTNAVSSVSKQLEQVSTALSATKRHLTSRLDFVTKTLDDSMTVQGVIRDQVIDVRGEVVRVGGEIENVQRIVEGLEVKLDEVQYKQDFTNQGIILLCQFVQGLEGGQRPELLQGAAPFARARLEHATSSKVITSSGLKELQLISEAISSGNGASSSQSSPADKTERPSQSGTSSNLSTSGSGSRLQRTFTPNLSFSFKTEKS